MYVNLRDTENYMNSYDYKDRFIAEYWQTKIRYEKLKNFCNKIEAAQLVSNPGPQHDCPLHLLREQQRVMGEYLHILELRAVIENVCLEEDIFYRKIASVSVTESETKERSESVED